jgi:peptide/nickel transport system substrate-binding protein
MLACQAEERPRVADTRQKWPIYVNLETGQEIGRMGPIVARRPRHLVTATLVASLFLGSACRKQGEAPAAAAGSVPSRGGELIASTRSEPLTYNRFVNDGARAATDVFTLLTQGRLVRVNRTTDDLEPWLAESWTTSPDGLTYTLTLKPDVLFSDGVPFTSADVLFSFRVAYDPDLHSPIGSNLTVYGKKLDVAAPNPRTVVIRFPEPFVPGLRLLDGLPIVPRHKLEAALDSKQFQNTWLPSKPLTDVAGLGPFQLAEHVAGQRLVFTRNPHYFRRDQAGVQLPYLDRLTLAVVPDQNTEALSLEGGEIDLMSNGDIRSQDYAAFKRLSDQNRLRVIDVSVGLDPDFLAFNLSPGAKATRRAPWLARQEFRQAISCAVDRQAIVNTVYLGVAAPLFGPVTPGNRRWHADIKPACANPTGDRERARQLLAAAGLTDRTGDSGLEDPSGAPARFSILTQAGHVRERVVAVLQEQLRQVGIAIDVVLLDPPGLFKRWQAGDYDAIYFGLQASSTDPALNPDFWLSSGPYHFWNPSQPKPATAWEGRIDELMRLQATAAEMAARQRAFAEVQQLLADELPLIYFVAARVTVATSPRTLNPSPVAQAPQLLWSADTLAAAR